MSSYLQRKHPRIRGFDPSWLLCLCGMDFARTKAGKSLDFSTRDSLAVMSECRRVVHVEGHMGTIATIVRCKPSAPPNMF